jgi:hypothetical protein
VVNEELSGTLFPENTLPELLANAKPVPKYMAMVIAPSTTFCMQHRQLISPVHFEVTECSQHASSKT